MADPLVFCGRCQGSIARGERSVQFGGKTLCVPCSLASVQPPAPPAPQSPPVQQRSIPAQAQPPPHWDAHIVSLVLCGVGAIVVVGGLIVLVKGADKRAALIAAIGAGVVVVGLMALGVGQLVHLLMHTHRDVWCMRRLLEKAGNKGA